MREAAVIISLLVVLQLSCKKGNEDSPCQRLTEGLAAADQSQVKAALAGFIADLPTSGYHADNISHLCQRLFIICTVKARFLCFDCIDTLPSQTEISITFTLGGFTQTKIIDLSYTAAHEIVVLSMHE